MQNLENENLLKLDIKKYLTITFKLLRRNVIKIEK